MKKIYLCGPISGLSYGDCTDWRKYAASKLADDIIPLSPMRGKEYLKSQSSMPQADHQVMSTADAIIARDRNDVMSCDMLLANFLGAKITSIGSVVELGWADAWRKPVILVMEKTGNIHSHPFVDKLCGFKVHTLDEGIEVANAILSMSFAKKYQ
jgi:nucleoside 2-deoxyribosyltransferase